MDRNSNKYRNYRTYRKKYYFASPKRKHTCFFLCLLGENKEEKKAFYLQIFFAFRDHGWFVKYTAFMVSKTLTQVLQRTNFWHRNVSWWPIYAVLAKKHHRLLSPSVSWNTCPRVLRTDHWAVTFSIMAWEQFGVGGSAC